MKNVSYLTDHYDEKIKKIKEINAPLNFVFITDEHNRIGESFLEDNGGVYELAADAISSIQYILDRCPEIKCVVNGGDIGNDYSTDPDKIRASYIETMDALYRLSVPVYSFIGNHDSAIGNATDLGLDNTKFAVLPDELHKICMRDCPSEKNYYYIDFEKENYRFIFLDTSDIPYYIDKNGQYPFGWERGEISDKQAVWLEQEALKTEKHILIFSHIPLRNEGIYGTEGFPKGIKPYESLLNGARVYYAIKQCKNAAALIAGHVHYDNLRYDGDLLSITTLCSHAQQWAPSCPERTVGTITETAFDVFSIKDNMMYLTRFGAGEDRRAELIRVNR